MRIAISQPTYLPWTGYFDLIRAADAFVLLDTVQFSKQSWQQRNRVQFPDGRIVWLTVPVKGSHAQPISEVAIANQGGIWQRKHWRTIQACYDGAERWPRLKRLLEPVYTQHAWQYLADLNAELIMLLCGELGIRTQIRRASYIPARDGREERLIDICRALGANTYLSTRGAGYLENDELAPGLPIEWFDYSEQPELPLSVIDGIARGFTTADPVSIL